jgi:hypothetical protein
MRKNYFILKLKALPSTETSVALYQSARCNNGAPKAWHLDDVPLLKSVVWLVVITAVWRYMYCLAETSEAGPLDPWLAGGLLGAHGDFCDQICVLTLCLAKPMNSVEEI